MDSVFGDASVIDVYAWDSCSAHPVYINPTNSHPKIIEAIQIQLPRISKASGFYFYFAGFKSDVEVDNWREPGIMIDFVNGIPEKFHHPDTAAGWAALTNFTENSIITSAEITINMNAYYASLNEVNSFAVDPNTHEQWKSETLFYNAIILHEFGHALGLGHPTDENQLMWTHANRYFDYQLGDIEGFNFLRSKTECNLTNGLPFTPTYMGVNTFLGISAYFVARAEEIMRCKKNKKMKIKKCVKIQTYVLKDGTKRVFKTSFTTSLKMKKQKAKIKPQKLKNKNKSQKK